MLIDSSGSISIFFKSEECSTSDSSELRASCFPFDFLGIVLGPTMLEVTLGYSMSENDFLRERRLLTELEGGTADNRLKIDSLLV